MYFMLMFWTDIKLLRICLILQYIPSPKAGMLYDKFLVAHHIYISGGEESTCDDKNTFEGEQEGTIKHNHNIQD